MCYHYTIALDQDFPGRVPTFLGMSTVTMAMMATLRTLFTEYVAAVKTAIAELAGFQHIGYPAQCYEQAKGFARVGRVQEAKLRANSAALRLGSSGSSTTCWIR